MNVALEQTASAEALPENRTKKIIKMAGWAGICLWMLAFFTLVKLPEAKIVNLIEGYLQNGLAPYGITMRAEEASFSVFFGMKFKMKKIRLYMPPPAKEVFIDQIEVSPSLSSILTGKLGADIYLRKDRGDLSMTVAMRGKKKVFVDFKVDQLDIGKLELLPAVAKVRLGAVLKGKGSISMDTTNSSTLSGDVSIQIKNLLVDAQTLVLGGGFPFPIPQISISEAEIGIDASSGKTKIKTFKIGRSDKATDDLVTTMTGDFTLTPDPANTALNLQIPQLKASETLKSKLSLNFMLGRFKQADGTFSGITLQGPASQLHMPL